MVWYKLYNYIDNDILFFYLQVTAAEVAQVYHTVKHNLSYNSADCGLKLTIQTLSDSTIVKKMSCGRTKAEAIVTGVLEPKSIEGVLTQLKGDDVSLPFSLQTDASNKGNRKMFPLAVQFFTPEEGIVNRLLDFAENAYESAEGIVNSIQSSLDQMGLTLDNVSAFSADNANVNYGIHNSVFTKLKQSNSQILRGNCHAHIVHNTVKHALEELSVDVENIVLKVYGHFSISAKRRENLKDFCEFCDIEFHDILRHVVTRWLSLNPAISRLLENWPALKSYFMSIEDCPKRCANCSGCQTQSMWLQLMSLILWKYISSSSAMFFPFLRRSWNGLKETTPHQLTCMKSWTLF